VQKERHGGRVDVCLDEPSRHERPEPEPDHGGDGCSESGHVRPPLIGELACERDTGAEERPHREPLPQRFQRALRAHRDEHDLSLAARLFQPQRLLDRVRVERIQTRLTRTVEPP